MDNASMRCSGQSPLQAVEPYAESPRTTYERMVPDNPYTRPPTKSPQWKYKKGSGFERLDPSIPDNRRPAPVALDPNLPPEIAALFKTSSCNMCEVKLNSRLQSTTHYAGKNHAKKLRSTLGKLNEGRSNSSSAKADNPSQNSSKKRAISADGSELYCKTCNLSFTSMDHATQHYLGRNHQRILHGLKPLKTGYLNTDTGKWQRMPSDPVTATEMLVTGADNESPPQLGKGRFFCALCGISTTSEEQLEKHNIGQKHKKMLQTSEGKETTNPSDTLLASVSKGDQTKKSKKEDFSIYRTPSGKFYCSCCDITLNSESQFAQHVESKKHKLKKK